MAESAVMLTREIGLADRIDPTGKSWEADLVEGGHSLYRLVLVDDDGVAHVPRSYPANAPELAGRWTNRKRALEVLDNYLVRAWDMSDRSGKRSARDKYATKVAQKDSGEEVEFIAA